MKTNLIIQPAQLADAKNILELQYLCFHREAALYNDYTIAPLRQTLDELLAEYQTHCILVARRDGELVGSVRAIRIEDGCHIGRLIVHPRMQRQGIGSQLMKAVEREFQDCLYYELFTGSRSEGNLALYKGLGYEAVRTQMVSPVVELVLLQKRAPGDANKNTGAKCAGSLQ